MKKLISIIMAIVMMTTMLATFGVSASAAGDSVKEATTITLGKEYKNQSISEESPRDVFKFKVSSSGKVTFNVTSYYKYSSFKLLDAEGNELWHSGDRIWNTETEVMKDTFVFDLTKGTYYFSVDPVWEYHVFVYHYGKYTFKTSFKSSAETFSEPQNGNNNSIKSADAIAFNKSYKGQVALNDSEDYYKFTLKSAVKLTLKYTAYMPYSTCCIYDVDGNLKWGSEYDVHDWNDSTEKYSGSETFELAKGTYYLRIGKYLYTDLYDATGNYTFSINCGHVWKTASTVKATLTANGKLNQKCSVCAKTRTVVVKKASSFKLSATTFNCDGKTKSPTVTVKDSAGKTLKKGTDYTVTYASGRVSPGEYKVTVKMKGNYSGTKVLTFKILPCKTSKITVTPKGTQLNVKWNKVKGASGYKVTIKSVKSGSTIKTVMTTKNTLTVKGLKNGTKYKVIVTAYKTFSGKKVYSKVNASVSSATAPSAPKTTLANVKGDAVVKWKKITGASGYEVYRASSKGGTYKKIGTVNSSSKVKFTDGGVKNGKTYYYKVRAYTLVGGKKVYSDYSAVKKVKTVW